MRKVVVVGSINMDIVNYVDRHPAPGETIRGNGAQFNPGGKGANQAVAAAKSGGDVVMIGAVGNDAFGPQLIAGLRSSGVAVDHIAEEPVHSGLATITVDKAGENLIVLASGANDRVSVTMVTDALNRLHDVGILLCQNEIPWETTKEAIVEANRRGIPVILNPAPAREIPDEVLRQVDTFVLNESEAALITGVTVTSVHDAERAASVLLERGVRAAVITLGEQGSLYADKGRRIRTPAFQVHVVDSTAAGDTFIGAYAVESLAGVDPKQALQFATAASAIAVTQPGAQDSIPSRSATLAFLASQRIGG